MNTFEYDLVTIGAGSGGVRASRVASKVYGAKVWLFFTYGYVLLQGNQDWFDKTDAPSEDWFHHVLFGFTRFCVILPSQNSSLLNIARVSYA